MDPRERAGTWLIGLVALVLSILAVLDLFSVGGGSPQVVRTPAAAELGPAGVAGPPVELHRLLPDATDDIGRRVRLDGTVVGTASRRGFWVRDLRDNVVFVAEPRERAAAVHAGDPVRVRGTVAVFPLAEQADRVRRAGLALPSAALVVRDVKILPADDGIEVLAE